MAIMFNRQNRGGRRCQPAIEHLKTVATLWTANSSKVEFGLMAQPAASDSNRVWRLAPLRFINQHATHDDDHTGENAEPDPLAIGNAGGTGSASCEST